MKMDLNQLEEALESREDRIILADVGAAGGVHERWQPLGRRVLTIGFEPDPRAYQLLTNSETNRWLNTALADKNGERQIFITRWQTNTSLYKPDPRTVERLFYPRTDDFDIIETSSISCRKLDDVLIEQKLNLDAIKLDTQGSELLILQGCERQMANHLFAVETEIEFYPLYQDQPLFRDVDAFMERKGFQLLDCGNLVYIKGRHSPGIGGPKGQLVAADALYVKSVEAITSILTPGDKGKLARMVLVCLVYGYPDFAVEICRRLQDLAYFDDDYLERVIGCLKTLRHRSAGWPIFPGRFRLARLLEKLAGSLQRFHHAVWVNPLGNPKTDWG